MRGAERCGEVQGGAGQLVLVAHHEDRARGRQRVEERARQVDVEHRALVDDDGVCLERVGACHIWLYV